MDVRDPENELYDRACDLVEAAAAIRNAMRPQAAAVVPALLGCLEAGLADLRRMSSALPGSLDTGASGDRERVERGLLNPRDGAARGGGGSGRRAPPRRRLGRTACRIQELTRVRRVALGRQ